MGPLVSLPRPPHPPRRELGAAGLLAAGPPAGFEETTVVDGLTEPTAVRFAPDGRIFVAEKRGVIKVFDGFGT